MAEATPDLSEFIGLNPRKMKRPCQIAQALQTLTAGEREQITAACGQDIATISNAAIRDWLARRNHDVSVPAITNHRRGICACA